MPALVIPTTADPFYSQRTKLDGREYTLHFSWNDTEGRWYLRIHTEADEPIIEGLKLVSNWPLLRYYRAREGLPPGELLVLDETLDGSPPGRDELGEGKRCTLVYATPNEL